MKGNFLLAGLELGSVVAPVDAFDGHVDRANPVGLAPIVLEGG